MIYDSYLNLKEKFENFVVLIKVGNFYHIYDKDDIILNYLLKYQIIDNRVGFPVSALKKVLGTLEKNKLLYK